MTTSPAPGLTSYRETGLVPRLEALLGPVDPDHPQDPRRIPVDQYHLGGPHAVVRLLADLDLADGARVLDVGSGLGGPARFVAVTVPGSRVVGVDVTAEYVQAATWLAERTGTADRVSFRLGEVSSLPDVAAFDAAMTLHVSMNVPDHASWYASIRRRLTPGGLLGVWELCTAGRGPLGYPMPWSVTGEDSHVATVDGLRSAVEAAGFQVRTWEDDAAWLREWLAAPERSDAAARTGLDLLDDGPGRALAAVGALLDGRLTVVRGVAVALEVADAP